MADGEGCKAMPPFATSLQPLKFLITPCPTDDYTTKEAEVIFVLILVKYVDR